MKVLQTLGSHAGNQPGIFQYWREPGMVVIDMSVGQVAGAGRVTVPNNQWDAMLVQLATLGKVQTVAQLNAFVCIQIRTNPSEAACVVAIMEHEGSIDHYGGIAGPGISVDINLKRQY
jgi:hypothetical protein